MFIRLSWTEEEGPKYIPYRDLIKTQGTQGQQDKVKYRIIKY